ncbi:MAG: hypothetical protein K2Y23_09945 [Cyanobacteria bacterium]|nr:hypothetical protein [Cyanobacteriota bacterium]
MRWSSIGLGLCATTLLLLNALSLVQAQAPPNFSGTWVLNTAKSKNLGMMSTLETTLTISQTATELVIKDASSFQGQQSTRELHYDLTGKPTTNEGTMGDRNETVAKWVNGKLVATWTSEGAVAGTKVVRTETRALSPDGKTMTVESVRGSNAPLVMVFDKKS